MFIKGISLTDHPFIKETDVAFSLPDGRNVGSGLNYIVGQSGSGKSKFLETFLPSSLSVLGVRPSQKIDKNLYLVKIFIENDSQGGLQSKTYKEINPEQSKRIEKDFLYNSEEYEELDGTGKLSKRLRCKNRREAYYPKTFANSGIGEARYNIIMNQIREYQRNDIVRIIMIEEPEAFLDPENQLSIQKALAELAITKQVFVSTHSPYLINWQYLQNGCSVFKMNRYLSETIVGKFCDPIIAAIINNPGKRNPQLNGVETKNLFFANKIFVVEGQEDVGLITDYSRNEKYDFTFFGYGAGSNSKIENVLKLCSDLKIQKVAALFDNNIKEGKSHYQICKKLFPEYKIEKLLAEDIRDKYGKDGQSKVGAYSYDSTNETYYLKNDEFGNDYKNKIKLIVDYFE